MRYGGVGKSGIALARVNTYPWFIVLSFDPRQLVLKCNLMKISVTVLKCTASLQMDLPCLEQSHFVVTYALMEVLTKTPLTKPANHLVNQSLPQLTLRTLLVK